MPAVRILYIEDSPDDVELMLRTLKREGLDHDCATTGDLAEVEKLLAAGGFDVILSDFSLKKFDAAAVLARRNEMAPRTPFIIVTGTLPDERAVELLKLGATDYVLKDRVSRLVPAIRRALAEKEERAKLEAAHLAEAESEARYQELFESSMDLIFLLSPNGLVTAANPAFARLLGLDPGRLGGVKAESMVPEEERGAFAAAVEKAFAGKAEPFETAFLSSGGRRLEAEGVFYPRLKCGRTACLQGVFRDMTEKRALEAQLRQAQKMDAVGRLAGGIAHDFNNILGAIEGYATLTLNALREDDPVRPDIEEIRKNVARAAALTRQLLVFSRRQELKKVPCCANSIIEDLQKMVRRVIGEDIRLELDLAQGLPRIKADAGQMEQLLLNLFVNARDAMPRGGAVTVATRAVRLAPAAVRAPDPARAGENFVRISVRDTGCGMPPEVRDHLFEPFFTTKEQGKGTGLGLFMVYGLVKQHNGWVEVESAPGKGSEFAVFLPAST